MKRLKMLTRFMVFVLVFSAMFGGSVAVKAADPVAPSEGLKLSDALTSIGNMKSKVTTDQYNTIIKTFLGNAGKDSKKADTYYFGTRPSSYDTITDKGTIDYGGTTITVYNNAGGTDIQTYYSNAYTLYEQYTGVAASYDSARGRLDLLADGMGMQADVGAGVAVMSGMQGFITMALGVIAYVAIIGMAVFTAFDVCYITMPVVQSKFNDMGSKGGAGTRGSKAGGGGGDRKMALITDDAINAVSEGSENNKNPLGLYLKKRIVSYIAIAIVLYILLSGNIAVLVNLALKAVEGLINQLGSMAR